MHLRAPSIDKGVSAFWWAFFFFLYLFFGMLAVGVAKGSALIFSALAGFAILRCRRSLRPKTRLRRSAC